MIFEVIASVLSVDDSLPHVPIRYAVTLVSRARWRKFSLSDFFFVLCVCVCLDVPPYVYATVSRCVSLLYRLCLCWFGHNTAPRFLFDGGFLFFLNTLCVICENLSNIIEDDERTVNNLRFVEIKV